MAKRSFSAAEKSKFAAERAARAEEAKASLMRGLHALQTSDDWRNLLAALAKSARSRLSPRRYSFTNQVLLLVSGAQGPIATYRAWQRWNRSVKKGEKAFYIRQPRPFARERENAETGESESVGGMYFRFIPVFTLDQTDGEDLPDAPRLATDVDPAAAVPCHLETLRQVALAIPGGPVSDVAIRPRADHDPAAAQGWYVPRSKAIVVVDSGNAPHMFKTLCHEVAHALLHGAGEHHATDAAEVEAESVAFIVCSALNLDTSSYSFPYVASWAGKQDAAKMVLASGERIMRAANVVLDAFFGTDDDVSEAAEEAA